MPSAFLIRIIRVIRGQKKPPEIFSHRCTQINTDKERYFLYLICVYPFNLCSSVAKKSYFQPENHVIFGNLRHIRKTTSYPESWHFNLSENLLAWCGIGVVESREWRVESVGTGSDSDWVLSDIRRELSQRRSLYSNLVERRNLIIDNNYRFFELQCITFFKNRGTEPFLLC